MGTGQKKKLTALSNWAAPFQVQVTGAARLGNFHLGFPADAEFMSVIHNIWIHWLISKGFGKFFQSPQPLRGAKGHSLGQAWKSILVTHSTGKKECCNSCPKPSQSRGQKFAHKTDVIEGFSGSCFNNSRWNLPSVWLCPVPHWGVESRRFRRGGVSVAVKAPNPLMATRKQK